MHSEANGTYIISRVYIEICIHVSFVSTPDCSSHAWPRLLDGQNTFHVVSMDLLAGDGVDDGRFNTEERQ